MKTQSAAAVTPRQRVFGRLALHRNRLLVLGQSSEEDRLVSVMIGLGTIATDLYAGVPHLLAGHLDRIAAWCAGWVEALGAREDVFSLIHQERDRQVALFVEGRISFECSSVVAEPRRKLRVLIEEVGEVAEAIDEWERWNASPRAGVQQQRAQKHLVTELIQVAAVCVAWLESLEAKV